MCFCVYVCVRVCVCVDVCEGVCVCVCVCVACAHNELTVRFEVFQHGWYG